MKRLTYAFFTALIAFTFGALAANAAAAPRHYVVAIGVGLPVKQGEDVFKLSMDLLLNRAQAGDRVEFIAAPQGNLLAAVVVPAGTARARANSREYASKFGALKQFLCAPSTVDQRLSTQLRLPQLTDEIARSRQPQNELVLILVGSPLYLASSEREAAFDMEKGLTPGDGMIAASVNESLFGTAERKGQLRNTTVHWLTPTDDWAVGEMHRRAVTRFWTLFFGEQGAALSTFSGDIARVFEQAVNGDSSPVIAATLDPNDRGLVMRPPPVFKRETAPAIEARLSVPPAAAHANRLVAPRTNPPVAVAAPPPRPAGASPAIAKAVSEIPRTPAGRIGIAAIWEASAEAASAADVDLYVAARPGAPEVFWRRAEATDAIYYRDIRHAGPQGSSADWTASWEYVEVKHEQLQDVSVWLNIFDTKGPVKGILRIQYRGQTVDRPFQFDLDHGNHGTDTDPAHRRQSRYWQAVNLPEFFPSAFPNR